MLCGNYPINAQKVPVWDLGVVSYRRIGQRGPRRSYGSTAADTPIRSVAIEACDRSAAIIEGVTVRRGETPTPEPVMQPGAGWIAPEPRQPGSGAAPPSIMMHGPPDG